MVTQLNTMPKEDFEKLNVIYRVLTQQRDNKNTEYRIHELEVLCIAKGKEHKPYEFINKSSFAYIRKSGIIVGAMAIEGNTLDDHTFKPSVGTDQVIYI